MATLRATSRLQVGTAPWIVEERTSAMQIADTEVEEFSFSARNEVDWLNEHMAEIFNENEINVAEIFKTPGKLRGRTPRTARKASPLETRAPLSNIFSTTPRGAFGGLSPLRQAHTHFDLPPTSFRVAEDKPSQIQTTVASSSVLVEDSFQEKPAHNSVNVTDSGYFGSQYMSQATQPIQHNDFPHMHQSPKYTPRASPPKPAASEELQDEDTIMNSPESEEHRSTEGTFHTANDDETRRVTVAESRSPQLREDSHPILESPAHVRVQPSSPQKRSPQRPTSPLKASQAVEEVAAPLEETISAVDDEPIDEAPSPSDGSSPMRPIVRKSSLNFASLPAREPLTTKKSIGNRASRTSHLDHNRTSYYGRQTGGKSLGNARQEDAQVLNDVDDDDEMDLDEDDEKDHVSRLHNKTSTQRLQDQISMLGKSQPGVRPSKSFANAVGVTAPSVQASLTQDLTEPKSPEKESTPKPFLAPGAFPEDEDDSWIGPPTAMVATAPSIFSPRPELIKSHTTDVMESIHGKDSVGGSEFSIPKRGESPRHRSPFREPTISERTTSTLGHTKSVSTSAIRSPRKAGDSPGNPKYTSVSNPNPPVSEGDSPPAKSPTRGIKGSPLKAAHDKFSSILKKSRGLFASSAAVSAEAKASTLSPSRMGFKSQHSFEQALKADAETTQEDLKKSFLSQRHPDSPGKASVRKTRASTEREERRKEEEAKDAREAKETRKMEDQFEKARQKVKEDARVYHLEQERVAAMQKQVDARKEQEILAKASQVDIPRATRSSPRKTKAQLDAEGIADAAAATNTDDASSREVEMSDVSSSMPPPATRPKSQIGSPPTTRPKSQIGRPVGPKRPTRPPAKETARPPTVIRVDTGSQKRGNAGQPYIPSNSTLAATLEHSLNALPQQTLRKKASTSSIQSNISKGNPYKSGATKALESAARKRQQEEDAAKRKREAKEEVERQRAAIKDEERRKEEQQRREEAERQQTLQRERAQVASMADAKKSASRQAMEKRRLEMEKAKQTGAPPPAIRPQSSRDLDKPLPSVPRAEVAQPKISRMNTAPTRPQDDSGRPIANKIPPKRQHPQDATDDYHSRPTMQRNPASYQSNDLHSKRRKTSENFDDDNDEDMTEPRPKMTAPPIRQSSIRPKEMQSMQSMQSKPFPFPSGYTNAPQSSLQKAAIMSQHAMSQSKASHPLDMAQISKATIPFAPSTSQSNAQHKTPARHGAPQGGKSGKSAAKSSPRYQNGENIELPEINTDSEDEDSDEEKEKFPTLPWTDSPVLKEQLARQEMLNPEDIFGQPGALNMEEVFSKSKDRFHKFRQRTSSANWSGQDRLTEDEIRKDLAGRDKITRQGGWTYDASG